jgi:predicted fused transcriptional regulator/phosphomethylpyrimidine kinase
MNDEKPIFRSCILYEEIEGDYLIAKEEELLNDAKKQVLTNMNKAYAILREARIASLVPHVKVNLAMSTTFARSVLDVCAFSSGISFADGKASSASGMEFGKSKHLAPFLLYIKSVHPQINSVMNLRLNQKLFSSKMRIEELSFGLQLTSKKEADILIHRGDFGIEPCA